MDDLTVKLTDYALSRDLFPQDYDCLPTDVSNESRPLKYMAIESINDQRFSTASDVVSFVVVLYSIMYSFFLLVVIWCSSLGIDESWFTTLC
jgi:RYK receptor-like tyrosine kinase